MSWRAIRATYDLDLIALDAGAVLVLRALAYHFNDKKRAAWPSKSTVARETGLSGRTVDRAVRQLEQAGLVQIEAQFRDNGSASANLYRLPFLDSMDKNVSSSSKEPPSGLQEGAVMVTGGVPSGLREGPAMVTGLEGTNEHTSMNTNTNSGGDGGEEVREPRELQDVVRVRDDVLQVVDRFRLEVPEIFLTNSAYLTTEKELIARGTLHEKSLDAVLETVRTVVQALQTGECEQEELVGWILHRTKQFRDSSCVLRAAEMPNFDPEAVFAARREIMDKQMAKDVRDEFRTFMGYAEKFHALRGQPGKAMVLEPRCWLHPAFHTRACFQLLWIAQQPRASYPQRKNTPRGLADYILKAREELAGPEANTIRAICQEQRFDIDAWLAKHDEAQLERLIPAENLDYWYLVNDSTCSSAPEDQIPTWRPRTY